jgi:AhpC/TSA antioxidant enzyme
VSVHDQQIRAAFNSQLYQEMKLTLHHICFALLLCSYRPIDALSTVGKANGLWTKDISLDPLDGGSKVTLHEYLENSAGRSLFVFGTYAADFNAIEYAQRLRYYLPVLKSECDISKFGLVLNCQPEAARTLLETVDLSMSGVDVFVDNTGDAGKKFGVERGWMPDNKDVNPFLKLFGMLWGLGAWATLPAVIGGYIGNPFVPQSWIEDALAVGQKKGRWPDTALEVDGDGTIKNKFDELPLVGTWPRRPLELATLRLQSMLGISLKNWKELAPDQEALEAGVLTQLGGCIVVENGETIFEWRDPGICAVASFESMIKKLKKE